MSEESSILDFGVDLADVEAPQPLPVRDYPAEIVAAVNGHSAGSGKSRADVTFRIKPEDYPADYEDADAYPDGKDVHFYPGTEPNKAAMFRLRKFCEAIGAPTKMPIDVNQWVGRSAIVSIGHDEFEGVSRERITKVEAK